jgi:UDP-N-acetylmuramoyl-L-alanyl-D-glutamate--2,6-diaminopimelate ligase
MNESPSTFSTDNDSREPVQFIVAWRVLASILKDVGVLESTQVGGNRRKSSAGVVVQLASDSRMIDVRGAGNTETACFVAIDGTTSDGHDYIDDAIANGARIIVCERIPDTAADHPDVLFAKVSNARIALAEVAAEFYEHPSRKLSMFGVTGTNGKTTVAYLMHHALNALGESPGLISTIEVRTGAMTTNAALTTPGALDLQRTLRHMADGGCSSCAMEVSSHALDQERARGVDFNIAIFTNLTSEHLDYHGTLSNYRKAKKKLFDGLSPTSAAVLNADDDSATFMARDTVAAVITYGTSDDADVQFEVVSSTTSGLAIRFSTPRHPHANIDPDAVHRFRLAGRFNAYNLAAAFCALLAAGYDADDVLTVLHEAPPVPGRFEQISFDDGTTVVVDYAHTPDALENILRAVRETMPDDANLWCVFGCGGDRDASKRRTMGTLAETLADRVIVTSDNPRTEEPAAILNDIRRGMSRPGDADWIEDRDDAIRFAAAQVAPGDVVLIAGKGHEAYQIVGSTRHAFDDRKKARTYFRTRPSS